MKNWKGIHSQERKLKDNCRSGREFIAKKGSRRKWKGIHSQERKLKDNCRSGREFINKKGSRRIRKNAEGYV